MDEPLAEVVNGHTKLQSDEMHDIIEKTVSHLEGILKSGWMPSGIWTDPIVWAWRKHIV